MKLPNCENAFIAIEKLRDYSLNAEHPRGKHKAKVFYDELGLEKNDAEILKKIIENAVKTLEAEETFNDEYGIRFKVDISYSLKDKKATIRTLWIIKTGEDFPRLTTCYIKR